MSALLHPRELQVIKDLTRVSSAHSALLFVLRWAQEQTDVTIALNQRVPTQRRTAQQLPKQHESLTPDLPEPHQIHVSITTANTTRHYPQRCSWIPVPTWAFITCEHKTHSSCTDSGTTRCSHSNKNTLNDWRQPTKVWPDLWSSFFNFPNVNSSQQQSGVSDLSSGLKRLFVYAERCSNITLVTIAMTHNYLISTMMNSI